MSRDRRRGIGFLVHFRAWKWARHECGRPGCGYARLGWGEGKGVHYVTTDAWAVHRIISFGHALPPTLCPTSPLRPPARRPPTVQRGLHYSCCTSLCRRCGRRASQFARPYPPPCSAGWVCVADLVGFAGVLLLRVALLSCLESGVGLLLF